MSNVLRKVIESRIAIKQAKDDESRFNSVIYDSQNYYGETENLDAGLKFEKSYRDLLKNYDKYSLMNIIEKFKGVQGFGMRK